MKTIISLSDSVITSEVIEIYKSNNWSSANKPEQLISALRDSHSLVTARVSGKLIGLGNAISDGHLVVYFPHLLVHEEYQGKGVGHKIMSALLKKYSGFHQQMITADAGAIKFYTSLGFSRAGNTQSMWIYDGDDH